ncbi:MAG: ABC transporter substrate-binding protein, partial [Rhodospirillales bacterium]
EMRILGLILATAMLLCGGAAFAQQQQSDVTIKVGNYGGQFTATQKKYAGDLFTRRTGAKIQYIDANPSDHLAKLIASKGREAPYDVVYLDLDVQANAIKAGVLEKFDNNMVPNYKFIYDEAKNHDGYGPGMMIYTIGIAYNAQKFKEAGIPEPTSWSDLWDPRLAGKVMIPDLSSIQGRAFLIAISRLMGGDETHPEKGIEKIGQLKYHSIYTSSVQVEALFPTGDIWAAPFADGRTWGLIDKGVPLKYLRPKEGAVVGMGMLDVVKGSKHQKEAYEYIDAVLDAYSQLGQAYEIPYGPTNSLLAPIMAAYPNISKKFTASLSELKQSYVPNWVAYNSVAEKAIDLWNRQVIRK